jgi:hypothetical protein
MHPTQRGFAYLEHLGLSEPGMIIVYLLHLDPPYKHAGHYLGSTDDLDRRLSEHGGPHGSPLLAAQKYAGGSWHLVRTWTGGRNKESELKSNNGKRYCPECTLHPLPGINTIPRIRKTRSQRRREHLTATAQPVCEPERLSLWQMERIPVPVTDDEWLRHLVAMQHEAAHMTPKELAVVPSWHPAADFRHALLTAAQTATPAGGNR